MTDIRFPTALQMMLTLALAQESGHAMMTSFQLANGLGSTASLVRRLLVPLGRDGLVLSSMGKSGGVRLAKPARDIALSDIYRSVMGEKRLLAGRPDVPHLCDVSSNVEAYFRMLAVDAEEAVLTMLGQRTLDSSLHELLALKDKTKHKSPAPKPGRRKVSART